MVYVEIAGKIITDEEEIHISVKGDQDRYETKLADEYVKIRETVTKIKKEKE